MSEIDDLRKEVAELRKSLKGLSGVKLVEPVKVDLTYLCPKDPQNKSLTEAANGEKFAIVMPDDGPKHLSGFITDIRNVAKKHRTMGPEGREIQFEAIHQTATWICATDGSEIKLDPYRV